jgi:hypothetical protein
VAQAVPPARALPRQIRGANGQSLRASFARLAS